MSSPGPNLTRVRQNVLSSWNGSAGAGRRHHPRRMILLVRQVGILNNVNPRDRLRSAGRRVTDPAEGLAQQVAGRVIDLVANALDVNALVARVDLNAVLSRVDVNALLTRVDVNQLVSQVDLAAVLEQVDMDALLARVDVNELLARVDVNELVSRVDVDAVLDQVDVNHVVQQVDMDALVEETDLGAVIARSSGGALSEVLDALRSQTVGLDQFIDRWVARLTRRKQPWPAAPPALRTAQGET
jgi:hypothetical protein